jgi:enoyl-CoA hydratase/carnithine racemase
MSVDLGCEQISASVQDSILRVAFNRPEKKNALTQDMYTALVRAIDMVDGTPELRALYITGEGPTFTSGNDVLDFMNAPLDMENSPVAKFLVAMGTMQKPFIAAVNGLAIGIGTTLLLHCDLAYSASSAYFQMPFVNLGLCPEAGSSYLLPKIMGHTRASELLLLGERFNADKAKCYGILNDVFPDDELQERAWAKAVQVASQPPGSVRLTKKLLRGTDMETLAAAMKLEGEEFAQRLSGEEAIEAFTCFIERRKPDFSRFS